METNMNIKERLTHLLELQAEARDYRAGLVEARAEIVARADADGERDLSEEEDNDFRAMTREIAELDEKIAMRDELVKLNAELHGLDVPTVEVPADAEQRAAAAEIFTGWRANAPRNRGAGNDDSTATTSRRQLTLAQARAISSLDTNT